jgi:hypothetical protein
VKSALKSIGQSAFQQSDSGNHSHITRIYVWDSVKTITRGAFTGYGIEGGVDLYTNQTPPADWDNIGVKSVQEYYGEL